MKNIDTPLLEDAYKTYIGRILNEASEEVNTSGKETKVLAEGTKPKVTGVTKKGNDEQRIVEESAHDFRDNQKASLSDAEKEYLQRIAGV